MKGLLFAFHLLAAANHAVVASLGRSLIEYCDFEDGSRMCGFTNVQTNDFDWQLTSQTTGSQNTGPQNDHTYQSSQGHYTFIDASNVIIGGVARLVSPVYRNDQSFDTCMNFYYYMYGSGVGTLNVYIKQSDQLNTNTTIVDLNQFNTTIVDFSQLNTSSPAFSQSGDRGQRWIAAAIDIPSSTFSSFQVIFEGIRGTNYRADIAIDDITISAGGCFNDTDIHTNGNGTTATWAITTTPSRTSPRSMKPLPKTSPTQTTQVPSPPAPTTPASTTHTVRPIPVHCAQHTLWYLAFQYTSLVNEYKVTHSPQAQNIDSKVQAAFEYTSDDVGFIEHLKLNCNFSHVESSEFSTLMALIVSKSNSFRDDDYFEVATLHAYSQGHVNDINVAGALTLGQVSPKNDSFISLEWSCPDRSVQGRYRCQAFGMDQKGHPLSKTAYTDIKEESRNVDLFYIESIIRNMDGKLNGLNTWKDNLLGNLGNSKNSIFAASGRYQDKDYFLSGPVVKNSAAFRGLCQISGGYLVEINDPAEFNFVANLIGQEAQGQPVIVGASDENQEGAWLFQESGIPVTYFRWEAVQPDGGRRENCMSLSGNLTTVEMDDVPCTGFSMARFVCESKP